MSTTADVALVSTWEVRCGIAGFTAGLRSALDGLGVQTAVVPIDRERMNDMARSELTDAIVELGRAAGQHRVVHVQHEYSFFAGAYGDMLTSIGNYRLFMREAKRAGAERFITTHHSISLSRGGFSGDPVSVAGRHVNAARWTAALKKTYRGTPNVAVAPSKYLRRLLIDSGVPAASVRVIPQGVPALRPQGVDRAAAKVALGLEPDAVVHLLFGFVASYKGHDTAIAALKSLPKNHHLVIVGGPHPHGSDGAYEHVLGMAGRKPFAGRVHVTGWVSDAEAGAWFDAADTVLAPYHNVDFATSAAAFWAMTSGRPLIASRIPAFRELADEWDCLELVPPTSPRVLAETMQRLTTDSDRTATLVKNATRVCEEWAWPNTARRYAELYRAR